MWPQVGEQNTPQTTRILSTKPFAKNVSSLLTIKVVMNDFPLIGDLVMIMGSPGGKHCNSLQRKVVWVERFS